MNEDPALGWYDSQGIVFVPVSVARDPDRLAEVLRHESTHHRLARGTSYGLLQQAVAALRPVAWEAPSEAWSAPADLLDRHSRGLQEAAATYCSLVVLDPTARAAAVKRLPELYLSGHQRFAALLDGRGFDAERRSRIALAIAARCLDTTVVGDWQRLGLADPRTLAGYLEQAGNSPDRRSARPWTTWRS
ncbi:hypothetical protein [Actinoplanes sp. GCM10030250]|uniref:hypothetical protein n=1 Tax=Actinoplanes sp. GCM10030250 TaxID=3273376 RepID=UPI003607889D